MDKKICLIRTEIDAIDTQFLELIKRRLLLVRKIGELKSEFGLPIYDPKRETEMIVKIRALAENNNISADLIEDIIKRLIHESYANEIQPIHNKDIL
jgi:chorismate mutase/prephenate dehydrogenase